MAIISIGIFTPGRAIKPETWVQLVKQSNFDFAARVVGGRNGEAMKLAAGLQIAALYGSAFRSTVVYFLQDDHDHW